MVVMVVGEGRRGDDGGGQGRGEKVMVVDAGCLGVMVVGEGRRGRWWWVVIRTSVHLIGAGGGEEQREICGALGGGC